MSHDHHDEETLGKPYDARLVRRLMTYVRPYVRLVTLAVLMLVAVTCFELAIPYLTRMALDDYIVANSRLVTDDGGEVAREFVGRRRQAQDVLRAFRGDERAGVLIFGMGSLGKSSLAARVARA